MLSVMIADDEKKVGELVKELIEWERLGLTLAGIVQDGQTAYEMIVEKSPDIVITDIRMPNLSGLELIKKVTERSPDIRFIVISGYRYFEYAQTALKYGVEDYLLKPIDEVELNKILDKIRQEESKRRNTNVHVQSLQDKWKNSRHILHRELMERVFVNSENHEVETVNKEYGVELAEGIFRAIGIKVDRAHQAEKNKQQERLILHKLSEMINDAIAGKVNDLVISEKESMTILVLLNYEESNAERIKEDIGQLFKQMKHYINDFELYDITMGLSQEVYSFSEVNLILEVAKEALDCRLLEGTGKCIRSFSKNRNKEVKAQELFQEQQEAFAKSIHIADGGALGVCVRQCFREMRTREAMASEFYVLARRFFTEYCELAVELFGEDMKNAYSQWMEEAGHCKTLSTLSAYTEEVLHHHMKKMTEKHKEMERKPVLEAIEYIKKHYDQKILLEEIAERSGFNANYFCEIFKNETGKNFSVYLLEVRMEAAKVLLRDSSEAIYEIAAKVGYKDSKFFSQQFVKVVGIKPTEYRKLYY